jgi:molecular chaperone DnaK (HSP70)
MSVVGIDLGTLNSVIAVARNRGVDVVSTRARMLVLFLLYRVLTLLDCK